jgi:hypothetical protein
LKFGLPAGPFLGCFLGASGAEHVFHREIPFMTGVLEDRTVDLLHEDFSGPWSRKGVGIVDRELIEERALIGAREAFDHSQMLAGSPEVVLSVKFVVSTTSVVPSQRPRESPSHR